MDAAARSLRQSKALLESGTYAQTQPVRRHTLNRKGRRAALDLAIARAANLSSLEALRQEAARSNLDEGRSEERLTFDSTRMEALWASVV